MTQPNLLTQAKQGDSRAIALLLNRALHSEGVSVKVSLKKGCLRVMLESERVPEPTLAVSLRKELSSISIESIERIKICGRQMGKKIPDWCQEFECLISHKAKPSTLVPSATSANNKRPNSVSLPTLTTSAIIPNTQATPKPQSSKPTKTLRGMLLKGLFGTLGLLWVMGCLTLVIAILRQPQGANLLWGVIILQFYYFFLKSSAH